MDPSDLQPTTPSQNVYKNSNAPRDGGTGGTAAVFFLFLLLAGAAAYYFAWYKHSLIPTAVAATGPAAAASPGAKPVALGKQGYTNAQREQYVNQAGDAFKALRQAKLQAFTDAFATLMKGGGFSAEGLTSKDAIAARRGLIEQCQTANNDYENFIRDQEATYKAELKKTPLNAEDLDYVAGDFAAKANTEAIIRLRDAQRDSLKIGDDIMAYADRTFGTWEISGKNFSFKKAADSKEYVALAQKYNALSVTLQKLKAEVNASSADPASSTGGGAPPATAPAGSPAAAPAGSPAAAATASPVAAATTSPAMASPVPSKAP